MIGDTAGQKSDQCVGKDDDDEGLEFHAVEGEMFGFKRNGHYRLILNRKKHKRLVVMPISFGHPAATDKHRSFAVRFVADSPVFIRELPTEPSMDHVLQTFCFPSQPNFRTKQGKKKVLLEDKEGIQMYGEPLYRIFQIDSLASQGGVVFVYLCVNQRLLELKGIRNFSLNLEMEATCRGMMCRRETGFLQHETLAKGKKFEASWRKFNTNFDSETATRLLMVLVQSGQDSEMGAVTCSKSESQKLGGKVQAKISSSGNLSPSKKAADYDELGIFNGSHRIRTEEEHAAMFGRNPSSFSVSNAATSLGVFDLDLERALALSRGDIEMNEALELSKRETGPFSPGLIRNNEVARNEDNELQLALARSKADVSGSFPRSSNTQAETIDVETYGDDLNEAIKRSLLEETKTPPFEKAPVEARDVEVIDLDATENLDQKSSPKRQKIDEPVIEIIDTDDDDDDEEDKGKEVSRAESSGADKSGTAEEDAKVSAADKRHLAAEAAEKRFNHKTD